jgi:DNA polymerase-3 subunit delta
MAASTPELSENSLKPLFYNNPFAVKQAILAINNYGFAGAEKILLLLHEYNLKNIGINNAYSGSTGDGEILRELAVKIIAA